MESVVLERWKLVRYDASMDRRVFSAPIMVIFAAGGALLTGLLAQIRLPLPFTPIPVTGQVLAVLLCGSLLGCRYGVLSQLMFIAAGLAGVPWLAGGSVGMAALLTPTAGYLVGFLAAAYFVGHGTRAGAWARTLQGQIVVMLSGAAIILFFGATYLMLTLGLSPWQAFVVGVLPFVAVDSVKAVMAAMLTSAVLPKYKR